jgi:hypothetical protein
MKSRRVAVFTVISVVLVLFFMLSILLRSGGDKAVEQQTDAPLAMKITNIDKYGGSLDDTTVTAIQNTLYQRVESNYHGTLATHYDAMIRTGTFTTQYHDYAITDPPQKVPSVTFIVDIPAVKESYNVSFAGGEGYPYRILYVTCPQTDQLIYEDFGCVDGTE